MGLYYQIDVDTEVNGDLVISESGDIALAEPVDSLKRAIRNVILTDFNDLKLSPNFGANLGSLIGNLRMNFVLAQIPILIYDGIVRQGILDPSDIKVTAHPVDIDKVLFFVDINGSFLDNQGNLIGTGGVVTMRYLFPYRSGELEELD